MQKIREKSGPVKREAETAVPPGYDLRDDGLFFLEQRDEGKPPEPTWISSPIRVEAKTRDADGFEWGRLLVFRDADGNIHEWPAPVELLSRPADFRAELWRSGLEMAPGQRAANLFMGYIAACNPPARARCVNSIGWHGDKFILPGQVIGPAGGERIVFQAATAGLHNGFGSAGTLDQWKNGVAWFARGNPRIVFAISTAFVPVLLQMANAEGFVVHLIGPSSMGKTMVAIIAGSAWGGGGIRGYILQWRTTANGLEAMATAHCDSLLALDEIAQVGPREAAEAAYMLTNGQGKARARRDGSGRPPFEWRTVVLSTGEIGLSDKIGENGGSHRAGQEVRVLDVPADAGRGLGVFSHLHGFPDGDAFARHLREQARKYYGTAAPAFIQWIIENRDQAATSIKNISENFTKEAHINGADGQVLRVANRFGLIAAAGEIATNAGILPLDDGEALDAAMEAFNAWLARRGGSGKAEVRNGLEQVRRFFQAHGDSRFQPLRESGAEDDDRPIINRAGYRQIGPDERTHWYCFPEVFRREICNGHDHRMIGKELVRIGALEPGADGKTASLHRKPGTAQPRRFFHINDRILGTEE